MTTKQIAEAVGRPEKTVRSWAKKSAAKSAEATAKMAAAQKSGGIPSNWSIDETVAIIETGMGKNAASLFRENANRNAISPNGGIDSAAIAAIVRETLTAMVPALIAAIRGVMPEKTVAALPAPPELEPRADLRRLVTIGGRQKGYREAWHELYEQFYYRKGRNIRLCAKNRGMDTIDYAEDEGLLGELLALAYQLFGGTA